VLVCVYVVHACVACVGCVRVRAFVPLTGRLQRVVPLPSAYLVEFEGAAWPADLSAQPVVFVRPAVEDRLEFEAALRAAFPFASVCPPSVTADEAPHTAHSVRVCEMFPVEELLESVDLLAVHNDDREAAAAVSASLGERAASSSSSGVADSTSADQDLDEPSDYEDASAEPAVDELVLPTTASASRAPLAKHLRLVACCAAGSLHGDDPAAAAPQLHDARVAERDALVQLFDAPDVPMAHLLPWSAGDRRVLLHAERTARDAVARVPDALRRALVNTGSATRWPSSSGCLHFAYAPATADDLREAEARLGSERYRTDFEVLPDELQDVSFVSEGEKILPPEPSVTRLVVRARVCVCVCVHAPRSRAVLFRCCTRRCRGPCRSRRCSMVRGLRFPRPRRCASGASCTAVAWSGCCAACCTTCIGKVRCGPCLVARVCLRTFA
jgi:hypothetical protein